MDIIYSKPNCPACDRLKFKYKQEGKEYREVVIGEDITVEQFLAFFPDARFVPYVIKE